MPDNMTTAGGSQSDNETPRSGMGFPPDNPDGTPYTGPDEYTRYWRQQQANRRPTITLSGNLADVDRLAEVLVRGVSLEEAMGTAGVDPKAENVKTGPQYEADEGRWNRETERLGLLSEPPPLEPTEQPDDVNVYDPTSQQPVAEKPKSSTTSSTSTSTPPKPKEK